MAKPALEIVVVGDSAMWGQGLAEADKFSNKATRQIGTLLEREARIVVNSARSGAVIRAGRTSDEARSKREEFLDMFPHLFAADAELSDRFIRDAQDDNDSQAPALALHHEHPASFPSINKQVQRVPDSIAERAELVLIDGGANDIDFQEVLNPEEHRKDFVKHYDPLLQDVSFARVRVLLRQTRAKFPRAVILYTGYFAPFTPGVANAEMRKLLEHMSGKPDWKVWFNRSLIEIKDVDQLVLEAQHRSAFAVARGLHWTRRAVAEANADPATRGPGILFIHPQFGSENTVFGSNAFLHREYERDNVHDAAEEERIDPVNCPRIEHAAEMRRMWFSVTRRQGAVQGSLLDVVLRARRLLERLNGPTSLLEALAPLAQIDPLTPPINPDKIEALKAEVAKAIEPDLKRISRVRIASFVHPNEKGAERYTNVIVKRYAERHHRIQVRDDALRLRSPSARGPHGLRASFTRFGLRSVTSVRAMSQLMLVDSIALEVTTGPDSQDDMFDDVFLNLGGEHRWQLNFPYRVIVPSGGRPVFTKILHRHFERGKEDLFTIDARGMHLGEITQLVLERRLSPVMTPFIRSLVAGDFSKGPWRPSRVTLHLNGIEVFRAPVTRDVPRGGRLTLPFPANPRS